MNIVKIYKVIVTIKNLHNGMLSINRKVTCVEFENGNKRYFDKKLKKDITDIDYIEIEEV